MVKLNLGCGQVRPENWVNTDSSMNSLVQQLPFGRLIAKLMGATSYRSANAKYMNLNKRWNYKDGSVDVVYASHLFEHLSLASSRLFLLESYRTLKSGGVIRLVVPDLLSNAKEYVNEIEKGNEEASKQFMWVLNLHREGQYPKGSKIHDLIGWFQGWPHQHKYMYDKYSLTKILKEIGFDKIEESSYGASTALREIEDVEAPDNSGYGNSLYLEAIKK